MRVGTSGWVYAPWRGVFYPEGLGYKRELAYLSRKLTSAEINGSFYSLQRPSSYLAWREQTPDDFVFAVKGGRYITHMKKLRDVDAALANFFASGVLALEHKLGPVLWQLPANLAFHAPLLAEFFDLLPRDTASAVELAERHTEKVDGRAWTSTDANRPVRHAVEVRHPSFAQPAFVDLLRDHRIALVVADSAGTWPYLEDVTADFVYLRLHGATELYTSGYTAKQLDSWAALVRSYRAGRAAGGRDTVGTPAPTRRQGRDVFVYFDNDVEARAPWDAMALSRRLGIAVPCDER